MNEEEISDDHFKKNYDIKEMISEADYEDLLPLQDREIIIGGNKMAENEDIESYAIDTDCEEVSEELNTNEEEAHEDEKVDICKTFMKNFRARNCRL